MLIQLKKLVTSVMINNMSLPICNYFHTRQADSSKITFFQGVPLFNTIV